MKKSWVITSIIIGILFLLVSYIPNFYEASVTKLLQPDRQLIWGEHIYTYDYNVYLSKIRQGMEGRWNVVDKHTNQVNQSGVFLQMLYLLGGKAGGVLTLSPSATFHLMRAILSLLWVITIVVLNFYFLKKPSLAAIGVILSLLAASFPTFYEYKGETWIGMYMGWWQEMDVLKRISYIPHYTLNYIILAVLTILMAKTPVSNDPPTSAETGLRGADPKGSTLTELRNTASSLIDKNFIMIAIILFLSFFIHPAGGLVFLMSWFIYHLILFILRVKIPIFFDLGGAHPASAGEHAHGAKKTGIERTFIFQSIILILISIITLLYFRSITSSYPWKSLVDYDKNYRIGVNLKEYLLALGPIVITGAFGLLLVFFKKERRLFPLVSWILAAFAGILIFKRFPYQSELRFVQTANHIPLAILSVYFLNELQVFLKSKGQNIKFKSMSMGFWILNLMINFVIAGIILLGITQTYFSIKAQTDFIHQRAIAGQPLVPYPPQVMYPLKDFVAAMQWLDKNSKNEEVVLSQVTAGNYIPAYSGNFVYLGHDPETPFYNEKSNLVNQFFSGQMEEKEALKFLNDNNISYVFNGPQEQEKAVKNIKDYSFLKPVHQTYFVTVFKVK